jgi:hypothetical protein
VTVVRAVQLAPLSTLVAITASAFAMTVKTSHRVAPNEAIRPGAKMTNGSCEQVHSAPAENVVQISVRFMTPSALTIEAERVPVTSKSLVTPPGRVGFAPSRASGGIGM